MKIRFRVNTDALRDAEKEIHMAGLPLVPADFTGVTRVVDVEPWEFMDQGGRQFWESMVTVELIGAFNDPSTDS